MKTKKIVFSTLILCFLTLSVMGKNNFNIGWSLLDDEVKMISEAQVNEFVGKKLVQPIKTCYTEANPHAFMTKCYSDIHFVFDKQYDWQITEDKPEREFYENQQIVGELVFTDCGMKRHIGQVKVRMDLKTVQVQESFFSDWESADDFTSSFCERVKNTDK